MDSRVVEQGGEVLQATLRDFGVDAKLIGMTVAMIAFGVTFVHWYRDSERKNPALGRFAMKPKSG